MQLSHSDEGLGKYTFLDLGTIHFSPAWTKVYLFVTARMEAHTNLKTNTLSRFHVGHKGNKVLLSLGQRQF